MTFRGRSCLVFAIVSFSVGGCASRTADERNSSHAGHREPYYRLRSHEAVYAGPGREDVVTIKADVIDIGWFGPADDDDPLGGPMWRAARLAIDHANAEQAGGRPAFRLVARWSENPWGTGIGELARLVYEGRIVAIVGAPDGSSAHLVEQIAAKARIPFISTASTDKTVNLANVPWVFSCVPGDHLWAPVMADDMHRRIGGGRWVMVSFTDHDSHQSSDELLKSCAKHGLHPARHFTIASGMRDFDDILGVLSEESAVLVVIGGATDTSHAVEHLKVAAREVFCGPYAARETCVDMEGIIVPMLWYATSRQASAFVEAYRERYACDPDYTAAYTYDGVRMLIESVRRVDANRVLVGDALRANDYEGVTGQIRWDPVGQNTTDVRLGIIRDSSLVPLYEE